jgi:hypothetical protein
VLVVTQLGVAASPFLGLWGSFLSKNFCYKWVQQTAKLLSFLPKMGRKNKIETDDGNNSWVLAYCLESGYLWVLTKLGSKSEMRMVTMMKIAR